MKTKRLADVPIVTTPNVNGNVVVNFTESDKCAIIGLSDLIDDITFCYLESYS